MSYADSLIRMILLAKPLPEEQPQTPPAENLHVTV